MEAEHLTEKEIYMAQKTANRIDMQENIASADTRIHRINSFISVVSA